MFKSIILRFRLYSLVSCITFILLMGLNTQAQSLGFANKIKSYLEKNNPITTSNTDESIQEEILSDHLFDYSNKEEIKNITQYLVDKYISQGRLQEAIWVTDRAGFFSEAEAMVELIHKHIENSSSEKIIILKDRLNRGVSHVQLARVGPLLVVIKTEDPDYNIKNIGINNEIAAWKLDRFLGLNLVPLAATHQSLRQKSIHLYVPGTKTSNLNFVQTGYSIRQPTIHLLDYLTNQIDRHSSNSLITASHHLVAIDNSRIGAIYNHLSGHYFPHAQISKPHVSFLPTNVISNLLNFNVDHFKSKLSKIISTQSQELIINGLNVIKTDLKHNSSIGNIYSQSNYPKRNLSIFNKSIYNTSKSFVNQCYSLFH